MDISSLSPSAYLVLGFVRVGFFSIYACVLNCFSCVQLFVTLWIVDHQAPLSMGLFRQEYWSGLPCPLPGDHPDPGIEPVFPLFPALAGRFFTTSAK